MMMEDGRWRYSMLKETMIATSSSVMTMMGITSCNSSIAVCTNKAGRLLCSGSGVVVMMRRCII